MLQPASITSFRDEVQEIDKEAALPLLGMLGGALLEKGVSAALKTRTAQRAIKAAKTKGKEVLKKRGLLPEEIIPAKAPAVPRPKPGEVPKGVW